MGRSVGTKAVEDYTDFRKHLHLRPLSSRFSVMPLFLSLVTFKGIGNPSVTEHTSDLSCLRKAGASLTLSWYLLPIEQFWWADIKALCRGAWFYPPIFAAGEMEIWKREGKSTVWRGTEEWVFVFLFYSQNKHHRLQGACSLSSPVMSKYFETTIKVFVCYLALFQDSLSSYLQFPLLLEELCSRSDIKGDYTSPQCSVSIF